MDEYRQQRHPLQTFQFWFLILMCSCGVIAWRTGLVSIPAIDSSSPRPVAKIPQEPMPPVPTTANPSPQQTRQPSAASPLATMAAQQPSRAPAMNSEAESPDVAAAQLELPQPIAVTAPEQSEQHAPPQIPEPLPATEIESPQSVALSFESPESSSSRTTNVQQVAAVSPVVEGRFEIKSSPTVEQQSHTLEASDSVPDQKASANSSSVPEPVQLDLEKIDQLTASGRDAEALRQLSMWYWQHPESRDQIDERLTVLSRRIFFHKELHYMAPYEVGFGDRFESIAERYRVPAEYLARINETESDQLRVGQKLKVIQGPFAVVIDLSDRQLTVHSKGYYVVRMPVAVGHEGTTPTGKFRITEKTASAAVAHNSNVPNASQNQYWIAMNDESGSLQGFGFQVAADPTVIGHDATTGNIQLKENHLKDLYQFLLVGGEVVIRP